MKRKLYFFVGTTAELIKIFPIMRELKEADISFSVIASGQNHLQGSKLFALAGVDGVDITLFDGKIRQSALGLLSWFFSTLFQGIRKLKAEFATINRRGSIMVVHGDTVSTVMGALIARKYGMSVAHVEAGLRSYNFFSPFPEEIDRVIVSRYATTSYCPNQWALDNLKGKKSEKINTGQNTLVDSLEIATHQKAELVETEKLVQAKDPFFVFVLHRQENLFNEKLVRELLAEVVALAKNTRCVFILHEPTRVSLEKLGLLEELRKDKNFTLMPRLPYVDFMKVLDASSFIITDGGSNQEESYYLGKPCLILRTKTERIEGLNENVLMSMCDIDVIRQFIADPQKYARPKITPKERPSKIIADHLTSMLHE